MKNWTKAQNKRILEFDNLLLREELDARNVALKVAALILMAVGIVVLNLNEI